MMSDYLTQKTIVRPVSISGVGIHSGQHVQLRLLPAAQHTGIVFRRIDRGGVEIPALDTHISSLELATTVGREDVTVSTVEHLMAACRIADIDNLLVELDGPEVPILDGSALPFLRLLESAGVSPQRGLRRILAVTSPLEVQDNGRRIRAEPYPGLRVRYSIDFPIAAIGSQTIELVVDRHSFEQELAPARTFTLLSDVEKIFRRGLARGGAMDNCIVFDDDGPHNTELRFADEPVRHKALDVIGDLALLGAPIWASLDVVRGGHQLHLAMLEALQEHPECWTWLNRQPSAHARPPRHWESPATHLQLARG